MKYFILEYNALNIKETGTQFQSIDGIVGDIQQDFIPFEGKINFPFKLPEPFLQKKAKPTTLLHVAMVAGLFWVFKKHFVEFLKSYNIGEFQTWDLKVHQNGNIFNDYKLFRLSETYQRKVIDFENSDFYIGNFINYDFIGEQVIIHNYEDFLMKRNELSLKNMLIKHKKINLNLTNINLDFFRIANTPASGYYVSENLKNIIEKERFTGFLFKEIEEMDKRIKVIY
jgi:hypothetical protein